MFEIKPMKPIMVNQYPMIRPRWYRWWCGWHGHQLEMRSLDKMLFEPGRSVFIPTKKIKLETLPQVGEVYVWQGSINWLECQRCGEVL